MGRPKSNASRRSRLKLMKTGVCERVVYVFCALIELKLELTGPPMPMTKGVERGTVSETASNNYIVAFLILSMRREPWSLFFFFCHVCPATVLPFAVSFQDLMVRECKAA